MNICVREDDQEAAKAAGTRLAEIIEERAGGPTLLLLSGGSALGILFYATSLEKNVLSQLTISVLDERVHGSEASNFAAFRRTSFFAFCMERGARFIDTLVSSEDSFEVVAKGVHGAVKKWFRENKNGNVIATFGIGEDAHTAGIMPYPKDEKLFDQLFNDPDVLVRGYDAGRKSRYPFRVTATFPLIRRVAAGVVFVVGEKKRVALKGVMAKKPLHEMPAAILNDLSGIELFTDMTV